MRSIKLESVGLQTPPIPAYRQAGPLSPRRPAVGGAMRGEAEGRREIFLMLFPHMIGGYHDRQRTMQLF